MANIQLSKSEINANAGPDEARVGYFVCSDPDVAHKYTPSKLKVKTKTPRISTL
jgi:hypothetical protein